MKTIGEIACKKFLDHKIRGAVIVSTQREKAKEEMKLYTGYKERREYTKIKKKRKSRVLAILIL